MQVVMRQGAAASSAFILPKRGGAIAPPPPFTYTPSITLDDNRYFRLVISELHVEKQTMIEFLKIIFILYFCLNVTYGIECPTESDKKCKQFWFKIFTDMGSNLEEGIKCLGAPVLPLKLSLYNPRVKIITVDEIQKVK